MTTSRTKAVKARQHQPRRTRPVLDPGVCVESGKARFSSEEKARARTTEYGGKAYYCLFCHAWHHSRGSYGVTS